MENKIKRMRMGMPVLLVAFFLNVNAFAQQYTGISGLIHVPSAEMSQTGTAKIGTHFLNKEFTPDAFEFQGEYHTADYYLSITPFSWVELAYTCTLQKNYKRDSQGNIVPEGGHRYYYQDRYFSVKLQPLKEGKWWPAIAVGSNDPIGTSGNEGTPKEGEKPTHGDGKSQYFGNFYIAATKHFDLKGHELGVHVAYRKWKRDYNAKWNGVAGGITYRPVFAKNLRAIAEYTGNDFNVGLDCLLWKHLLLQASLQRGKYFSGGVCFQMNLL